ncbi:MAG: hypothetical protein WDN67_00770 [Candidatus Moraniibacteriota bacterium]
MFWIIVLAQVKELHAELSQPLIIEVAHAYEDNGPEPSVSSENPVLVGEQGDVSKAAGAINTHTSGTAFEIIKRVSQEENIDWKLLWSVCQVESECNLNLDCEIQPGHCDGGYSFGAFQIYLPAHPDITETQANDFEWSARWAAEYGAKYKYNPELFCKNHNGIAKDNEWLVYRAVHECV